MPGDAACAMNKKAAGVAKGALAIALMLIVKVALTMIAVTMHRTIATTVMISLAEAFTSPLLI